MVQEKESGPLRLWIAGCATGEEVYSIAVMVAEALGGIEAITKPKVQIFATDIDDRALEIGRAGSYPISAANDIRRNIWTNTSSLTRAGLRYDRS